MTEVPSKAAYDGSTADDTAPREACLRRCARAFAAMWLLDVLAVVAVDLWWRSAVLVFLVGFGLAWLTAVALFMFQEARGAR